nr:uncharacterized protein LOC113395490 [Vanessa tameamea]
MKLTVILVLLLNLSEIYCEDEQDALELSSDNVDYTNIFQTIPTLYQYLFNLLQEKPEILERNDITTFTEDKVDDDEVPLSQDDNLFRLRGGDHVFKGNEENYLNAKRELDDRHSLGKINRIFYLTPDEVMEQMLLVEQKLEDYNSVKRN